MTSLSLTGKLVGMLAHDFRTPLSSVLLHLELLEDATGLSEEERSDVSFALASARALAEMISVAVDTMRLADGTTVPDTAEHDLSSICREAVERLSAVGAGVHATIRAPEPVLVRCDGSLTARAVRQLLVTASLVNPSSEPVGVVVGAGGGFGRVTVIDRGQAVPEDLRGLLFDEQGIVEIRASHRAFSRGIGPVFCRRVATTQGGRAGIDPVPGDSEGRGNAFWIELPLVSAGSTS